MCRISREIEMCTAVQLARERRHSIFSSDDHARLRLTFTLLFNCFRRIEPLLARERERSSGRCERHVRRTIDRRTYLHIMRVRELKAKVIRLDQLGMGNDFVVEALSESFALRCTHRDKNITSSSARKLAHGDLVLSRADQMMMDDRKECTDATETISLILFTPSTWPSARSLDRGVDLTGSFL